MSFEVRNEQVEATLKELGRSLKASMPEGYGFALFIAKFGGGGDMFYTSSIERQTFINLLREFISKFEAN